jgi:hypothetical protein
MKKIQRGVDRSNTLINRREVTGQSTELLIRGFLSGTYLGDNNTPNCQGVTKTFRGGLASMAIDAAAILAFVFIILTANTLALMQNQGLY